MTTIYSSKLIEIISPLRYAFLLKKFNDLEVMESGHWRYQKKTKSTEKPAAASIEESPQPWKSGVLLIR